MPNIKDVFENKLKIDSKTVSIESLFNDDYKLKNTNYKPSYQRNYVWDDEKATYFIESIILGTEIPPLIYFRNISKIEVIDGRQRYETILRFIKNEFKLKRSGLKKLGSKEFVGKNFDGLDKYYKDLIWETKLRIIEFSFNTKEGITGTIEETVKKEIFKRYNSGITPLKTSEVDKAGFLYDSVNQYFKSEVLNDRLLLETLRTLFHFDRYNEEVLMKKIRELLVIDNIPIKYFSVKKSTIINQFYEYLYSEFENVDVEELKNTFIRKVNLVENIFRNIKKNEEYNRLISECLFWAFSIYQKEKNHLNFTHNDLKIIGEYIDDNIEQFKMDRSSFAIHIKNRYEVISRIFTRLYGINFSVYLKDSDIFDDQVSEINSSEDNSEVISFDDSRINKPEPSSISIDDIIRSMKRQKFIIRPQYQRNEVIDKKKASSIIESILLGIKIPPLFVYKNKEGVSEVIDGQQRLLSILGFLGEDFINTDNEFESTKKDDYALSLKGGILSDLTSKKFKDLSQEYQEKIKNYDLWVVEIDAKYNKKFDPVDLFIRLNYKPYPIKMDSFEMWNSYISRELIDTIKDVYNNNKEWFYFRKSTTRMENENILTALIYLYLQFKNTDSEKDKFSSLDYYKVGNKINFRLKSKPDLTKSLENESKNLIYISNLFEADFLFKLKKLISNIEQKTLGLSLDYLLCVDKGRRTQQSLYALWYFVSEISISEIMKNREEIIFDIRNLFTKMNDVKTQDDFVNSVKIFKNKHCKSTSQERLYKIRLDSFTKTARGLDKEIIENGSRKENTVSLLKKFKSFDKIRQSENVKIDVSVDVFTALKINFEVEKLIVGGTLSLDRLEIFFDEGKEYFVDESNIYISLKRGGFIFEYLYLIFSSKAFFQKIGHPDQRKLSLSFLGTIRIPILKEEHQLVFQKIYGLIINENDQERKYYYINIANQIVKFLLSTNRFRVDNSDILSILDYLESELSINSESEQIYKKLSSNESQMSNFILRMNYLFVQDEEDN